MDGVGRVRGSSTGPRGPIVCIVHDRIVGHSRRGGTDAPSTDRGRYDLIQCRKTTTTTTEGRTEGWMDGWMREGGSNGLMRGTAGHSRPGDSSQLTTWTYLSKKLATHTHTHVRSRTVFCDNKTIANVDGENLTDNGSQA
jgi:hypothetical protein